MFGVFGDCVSLFACGRLLKIERTNITANDPPQLGGQRYVRMPPHNHKPHPDKRLC